MRKKIMGFLLMALSLFFVNFDNVDAYVVLDDYNEKIITDKNIEYKINVTHSDGNYSFTSGDESILTVDEQGVITPIKDGVSYVMVGDDDYKHRINVIVNINQTIEKEVEQALKNLPDVLELSLPNGFREKTEYKEYGYDYLYGVFYEIFNKDNNYDENIHVDNFELVDDKYITFKLLKYFQLYNEDGDGIGVVDYKLDDEYKIDISLKEFNQQDYEMAKEAAKRVKKVYNSYLNESFDKLFESGTMANVDLMMKSSNLERDLNNKNITYYLDSRLGNDDPREACIGGFLQIMVNDTLYAVAETRFERTLKIPPIKSYENIIDVLMEFFKKHFIADDEKVEIKKVENEENTYQAHISKKDRPTTLISTIVNFFIPTVKADSDDVKIVTFKVEQSEDAIVNTTDNISSSTSVPNTYDGVYIYIIIGVVSIMALVVLAFSFKNKNKK